MESLLNSAGPVHIPLTLLHITVIGFVKLDVIASPILGGVAGQVGMAKKFTSTVVVFVDHNHTDAERHRERLVLPNKAEFMDLFTQLFSDLVCMNRVATAQQYSKFVAAEASQGIIRANLK